MADQGADVRGWDADVSPDQLPDGAFDLVLLSVQQFEGLDRGLALARRLRAAHPAAPIIAFGQYAQMNSRAFLATVDAVAMD